MSLQSPSARGGIEREFRAPVAARIVQLEPALILEAMKMEHVIPIPPGARVREWRVAPGDTVETGDPIALL
jgi:biotin carboxyl carrier protein